MGFQRSKIYSQPKLNLWDNTSRLNFQYQENILREQLLPSYIILFHPNPVNKLPINSLNYFSLSRPLDGAALFADKKLAKNR